MLAWIALFLVFVFALVSFAACGALPFDVPHSRILLFLLPLTELVMVWFIGLHWSRFPWRRPLPLTVVLWLLWMPFPCLELMELGKTVAVPALTQALYCPLFFPFFYLLAGVSPSWFQRLQRAFVLLLCLTAALLFLLISSAGDAAGGMHYTPVTNAYFALLLLPWVLTLRRSAWRTAGAVLVGAVSFCSLKRTGMVAFVVAVLACLLGGALGRRRPLGLRFVVGGVLIAAAAMLIFINSTNHTDRHVMARFADVREDGGSGRLDIFGMVLQLQAESPIENWALGHGHDGVRNSGQIVLCDEPLSAHNDWQEVLFDYGLPAMGLFLMLHALLLQKCWSLLRSRSWLGPPFAASYGLFLVLSLGSHLVLYPSYYSYLMAFWGATCAVSDQSDATSFGRFPLA